jgi:ADP-ribose pyrophosphatase YjhB (NUDIX family)
LLAHPKRGGSWEVVNGALEAGETILDAALRETREEAGNEVQVQPLGTVHVSTFHYDENVRYMLSVGYLMAYQGGKIQPGDDMAGSQYGWWGLEDLKEEKVKLLVPPDGMWLIEQAIELHRIWKEKERDLQPALCVPKEAKPK